MIAGIIVFMVLMLPLGLLLKIKNVGCIVEFIYVGVFIISIQQWSITPYSSSNSGWWAWSILISVAAGILFPIALKKKQNGNQEKLNILENFSDKQNTQKNNSTQTNQSFVRKQQMVSSSWKIQSEPVGSWSEYGKDKRNYAAENAQFIADFLKKYMTTQLRDVNPSVSISETQPLKEIYFNTYLPNKDKYDRM
jgi:hypothetical protein